MPAGHPPIDGAHAMNGGGDDGAPIPTKPGELALPNLPGKKMVGCPRSGSSGPNLFFGPTGMATDVGALFW
jgi:hypothetical protein